MILWLIVVIFWLLFKKILTAIVHNKIYTDKLFLRRLRTSLEFYSSLLRSIPARSLNGIWCLSPPNITYSLSLIITPECPSLGFKENPWILFVWLTNERSFWLRINEPLWPDILFLPYIELYLFRTSIFFLFFLLKYLNLILIRQESIRFKWFSNSFNQKWIFHRQRCRRC